MNGRYTLVVVLLLGAFVFGLSTFVSDMFSEEPLAGSVSFAPSSVSRAGASAGGASSYHAANVPCVQMSGANYSLFHHHAASVPTYTPSSVGGYSSTPYIYIGSSSVAGSPDGQGAASSSAYGIYLTSSATTRSYGASSAASSASAYSYGAGGTASSYSASSSSVYSPASSVGTSSAFAYSSAAYSSANYASAQSAAPSISLSADQTLAARSEAPARSGVRKLPGLNDGGNEWTNWFDWYVQQEGINDGWTLTDGTYYFTEDQLHAAYDYWKATQSSSMPLIHTYDDWLAWITGSSNTSRYQLTQLPIGEGVGVLMLFVALYALAQIRKPYIRRKNIQTL